MTVGHATTSDDLRRPPTASGSGDRGGRRRVDGCHFTGGEQTPSGAPWLGSEREGDKTRLFQYVRGEPQGVPLRSVVSDVFGVDSGSGGTDYQLARRFFLRYSDYFNTAERGGLTFVEPRLACLQSLNLRQQYAWRKTSVRRGGEQSGVTESGVSSSDVSSRVRSGGDRGRAINAKGRTRSYLDNYLQVRSESVKGSLLKQLATEKAGIEGRWQVFKHNWLDDEYLCMPYRTRHTDMSRACRVRESFGEALRTAGRRHSNAVVLTVTTDPKEHSGLSEALQSLSDNKARLMSWLATDYQLGYRPENMSVLEFSSSGLPHYHIVLFGVSYVVSQSQLSAKWRDLGQGCVVDLRTARTPHDGEQWRLHDDSRGVVTLEQYLGKAIRGLQSVAGVDGEDLRDRVEGGDVRHWRQALYWATERQYFTCSPSLRSGGEGEGDRVAAGEGESEPEWCFVGVARVEQLPSHIVQSATFIRPPP